MLLIINLVLGCYSFCLGSQLLPGHEASQPLGQYQIILPSDTVATCSTVVAQDHPRCRGKGLECAAAGDHVAAVAGGIQACTEDGTVSQIIRQRKLSATVALTLQL